MSEKLVVFTRFFASHPAMIITGAIIGGSPASLWNYRNGDKQERFSRQHGGLILDYLPSCSSSTNFTEEPYRFACAAASKI